MPSKRSHNKSYQNNLQIVSYIDVQRYGIFSPVLNSSNWEWPPSKPKIRLLLAHKNWYKAVAFKRFQQCRQNKLYNVDNSVQIHKERDYFYTE